MNLIRATIRAELRQITRDKSSLFWMVLLPLLFMFIFGRIQYGSGGAQAALTIINQDAGPFGALLVKALERPDIQLLVETRPPQQPPIRSLSIPPDFSENLKAGKPQALRLHTDSRGDSKATIRVQTLLYQGVARLLTQKIMNPTGAANVPLPRDLLMIKKAEPLLKSRVPSGFEHTVPGVTVQFIMMLIFIFGGVSLIEDRRSGRLARTLSGPTTPLNLWLAKLLSRTLQGLLQVLILLAAGKLLFGVSLGFLPHTLLLLGLFSLAMGAAGLFLASLIRREDLLIGIAVLLANAFSALGGCWWPIEVVGGFMRQLAVISPAYWAMDGLHRILFFGQGPSDWWPALLALSAWTLVFALLSHHWLKKTAHT